MLFDLGLLFGYDSSAVAAVLLQLRVPRSAGGISDYALTNGEQSVISTIMVLGAMFGALLASYLNSKWTRRGRLISNLKL